MNQMDPNRILIDTLHQEIQGIYQILDEVKKALQGIVRANALVVQALDARLNKLEGKPVDQTDVPASNPETGREL